MANTTQPHIPPALAAHTLVHKMAAAARRCGDLGREFILRGVLLLTGRALDEQRGHARTAATIAEEIGGVDAGIAAALTDAETPGVITPAEAACLRARARGAQRKAEELATVLTVPAVEELQEA